MEPLEEAEKWFKKSIDQGSSHIPDTLLGIGYILIALVDEIKKLNELIKIKSFGG